MNIKWSPLAVQRLTDSVNYISDDNPVAGRKFAITIFKSIEKLKKFPTSGRVEPELEKAYSTHFIKLGISSANKALHTDSPSLTGER